MTQAADFIAAEIKRRTIEMFEHGKVVEGGFLAYRNVCFPGKEIPTKVEQELRYAFFAGAQHLFASINMILTADKDPTEKELFNMNVIYNELREFLIEVKRTKGL